MEFRDTLSHSNADALSRLPLPVCPPENESPSEVILPLDHLSESPVTVRQIHFGTLRDPLLSSVLRYVHMGWPANHPEFPELCLFVSHKSELSVQDGCLPWGSRLVIPPLYCESLLAELHEAHPGMSRMKSLSRIYVWWPGMDGQIEKTVQQCRQCQENQTSPPAAPLHPWQCPTQPWTRLHIDYCGPLGGKMGLVVVDSHSK